MVVDSTGTWPWLPGEPEPMIRTTGEAGPTYSSAPMSAIPARNWPSQSSPGADAPARASMQGEPCSRWRSPEARSANCGFAVNDSASRPVCERQSERVAAETFPVAP